MELDLIGMQSAIVTRLPLRTRWEIDGSPLDYDFSDARGGFRRLTSDDFVGLDPNEIERTYSDLLVFGRSDYDEGGGATPWITVRTTDRAVCGLDVERENAIVLFNSSIEQFIQTFALLNQYLGQGRRLPPDIEARASDIDPDAYPLSEWRLLIDCLA